MTDLLYFIGSLGEGGAQRVVSILTKYQVEQCNVEVLTYYDVEPLFELDERVKFSCIQKETGTKKNVFKNLLCLRKHFKEHRGVILSFLAPFNVLAMAAHVGLKTPIIVADRNDPRKVPGNFIVRKIRDFLYRFADAVAVQTGYNKKYFSKKIQEKSTIIYNPIDLGEKAGLALRTEKKKQIVTVARLMPQKNHKLIIDAFAEIANEFPEYEVVFYGDGPEKENIEQYIKSKNLSERFRLPGKITNVPERISEAEVFVLSSDYEGMPNALIEAMCVGMPVISTKVSGATDLIQNGANGYLIEVGDTAGLKNAIKTLLLDEELRTEFGKKATAINVDLNTDRIVERWRSLIESISK